MLARLDAEAVWEAATESERRVLVEELLRENAMFPDHLPGEKQMHSSKTVAASRCARSAPGICRAKPGPAPLLPLLR